MTPSKSARYLLARFIEPAFRVGPDSGERLIGVASFKEFEEKFTVALYDVPVLVRPADVLLLRFEPLIDVAAFATGCCFNWQLGGGTMVAVCQVLSKTVMKGFKATDPPTSSRIVGFREAGPLPPTVGEIAAGATDLWALSLEQQALDLHEAEDAQLVQHLASAADAVDEDGARITLKTQSSMQPRPASQLHIYNQTPFPALDNVKGIVPGELFVIGLDETQEVTSKLVDAVLGNGDGLSLEERSLLAAARQLCEVVEGEGVGGTEYRAYEAAEAAFLETRKGKK